MCYLEFNKSIILRTSRVGDGILMVIWKREGDHEPTPLSSLIPLVVIYRKNELVWSRQGSNPWPLTHKTNALTNWVTRPNENFKQRKQQNQKAKWKFRKKIQIKNENIEPKNKMKILSKKNIIHLVVTKKMLNKIIIMIKNPFSSDF